MYKVEVLNKFIWGGDIAKKISTLSIWFPDKRWKKIGYTSLCRYLWSSVMLAGPEVGDHFKLNLYDKVIPLKF